MQQTMHANAFPSEQKGEDLGVKGQHVLVQEIGMVVMTKENVH